MSKTNIAKKAGTAVDAYTGPSGMADNITGDDLRLPRISLAQALSPSVTAGTHHAGELINTLTQEKMEQPLTFTPCYIFKNVIKWKPREQGGGIVYRTTNITPEVQKDLQWVGEQKPIATAFINAVCLVDGQGSMPMIVSFCNTSYKAGQDLATLAVLNKPVWKYQYALSSKQVQNTKGTFFVFSVKRLGLTSDDDKSVAQDIFYKVSQANIMAHDEEELNPEADTGTAEPEEF